MKSTPITVYSGLAYIDEEYIEVINAGDTFDLSSYDIKFQLRDTDAANALLSSVDLTVDAENTNRVWPEMTSAITTAITGKNVAWMAMIRKTGATTGARLIGFGRVDVKLLAPVGGAVWQ